MLYEHCRANLTIVCTGGLQESTGTFAQFSRQVEEEDESKPPPPKDASSSTKTRQKVSPTNNTEAPVKKRTITKKPKIQQKYDYDEFVREVGGHLN